MYQIPTFTSRYCN